MNTARLLIRSECKMFRNVYLKNPATISLDRYQLEVAVGGSKYHFPFDDMQSFLIESLESKISTAALSELAEHGITVITCDSQHLPSATLLPLGGYYQHLKTLNLQLALTKRFKDRLTRKIIKQKIHNQGTVVQLLTGGPATVLNKLANAVLDGDENAREGVAARIYFTTIGGQEFNRRLGNLTNGALNYGFSILRSCIARELVQFGFEPALGFNHHNMQNPFNLADDLIEPFRPVVELYVFSQLSAQSSETLSSENKAQLLRILSYEVLINSQRQSVQYAIHLVVESLWTACECQKVTPLLLPNVVNLQVHENGE